MVAPFPCYPLSLRGRVRVGASRRQLNLGIVSFGEKIAKLHFVTLSEAKGLCPRYRILRFAQNDRLRR